MESYTSFGVLYVNLRFNFILILTINCIFIGQAQYIGDLPDLPNQLYACFVMANATPGSVIQSIDASAVMVKFINKLFLK